MCLDLARLVHNAGCLGEGREKMEPRSNGGGGGTDSEPSGGRGGDAALAAGSPTPVPAVGAGRGPGVGLPAASAASSPRPPLGSESVPPPPPFDRGSIFSLPSPRHPALWTRRAKSRHIVTCGQVAAHPMSWVISARAALTACRSPARSISAAVLGSSSSAAT